MEWRKRAVSVVLTAIYWWDQRSRAVAQPLYWKATPAVRLGYGEDKPLGQCHWDCTYQSDRTAVHHAHLRDRSRRRYNFSCQDRRLVAHVLRHCYQFLQDRYRSSTGHPTGSGHKRTPRSTGIFSTEWRFSPPTSHARISAAAYSGTAWLPAAQLQGGRVLLLRLRTAHRYVSGLPLLLPFEYL